MLTSILILSFVISSAYAGSGCKGNSCGISDCCNPQTQYCYTPSGFGGSYCINNGRHLTGTDENMWTKNIRIGYINIEKIDKSSKQFSIEKLTKSLHELIVNATILNVKSLYKRKDVASFFKKGTTVSVLLIKKSRDNVVQADTIFNNNKKSSKLITKLSFCPIDNNNIITLNVRVNNAITLAGVIPSADINGTELTVVISKNDNNYRYHWMVVVGDSNK